MKISSIRVVALVAVITGTAFAQSPSKNSLLISPGDNLHITVLDMPEMDQFARVTDAGDVPVQGIGNVRVVDMTPAEAATAIHDRYIELSFPESSSGSGRGRPIRHSGSDSDRRVQDTRCLSDCDSASYP